MYLDILSGKIETLLSSITLHHRICGVGVHVFVHVTFPCSQIYYLRKVSADVGDPIWGRRVD